MGGGGVHAALEPPVVSRTVIYCVCHRLTTSSSHDCPPVSHEETEKVAEHVENSGISLSGESEEGGWVGGRVVLVPTDSPIKEWKPIAEKKL